MHVILQDCVQLVMHIFILLVAYATLVLEELLTALPVIILALALLVQQIICSKWWYVYSLYGWHYEL